MAVLAAALGGDAGVDQRGDSIRGYRKALHMNIALRVAAAAAIGIAPGLVAVPVAGTANATPVCDNWIRMGYPAQAAQCEAQFAAIPKPTNQPAPKPAVTQPPPVATAPVPKPAVAPVPPATTPDCNTCVHYTPFGPSNPALAPPAATPAAPLSTQSPQMQALMGPLLAELSCMNSSTPCPTKTTPAAAKAAASTPQGQSAMQQVLTQLNCVNNGTPCPQAASSAGGVPAPGTPIVMNIPGSDTAVIKAAPTDTLQAMVMQNLPGFYCDLYPSGCTPADMGVLSGGPLPEGSTTYAVPGGKTIVVDVTGAPPPTQVPIEADPNMPIIDPDAPPPTTNLALPQEYVDEHNPITSANPDGSCGTLPLSNGIPNPLCTPPCQMASWQNSHQVLVPNPNLRVHSDGTPQACAQVGTSM